MRGLCCCFAGQSCNDDAVHVMTGPLFMLAVENLCGRTRVLLVSALSSGSEAFTVAVET